MPCCPMLCHANASLVCLQGKVSLLAHSLGSVLCYEILCNQPHLFDQLEFNLHNTHLHKLTSDSQSPTSQANQSAPQSSLQQLERRQASTEMLFAPMSSSDLDGDLTAPHSCPSLPMRQPKSQAGLSQHVGSFPGTAEVHKTLLDYAIVTRYMHDIRLLPLMFLKPS